MTTQIPNEVLETLVSRPCPNCKDGIVKRHVQFGAIQRCEQCNGRGVIEATHMVVPIPSGDD